MPDNAILDRIAPLDWRKIANYSLLTIAAVLAVRYYYSVDYPNYALRLESHRRIIDGEAFSPYQYRVLVPFAAEGFIRILSNLVSAKSAFLIAYGAYDLFAFGLLLFGLRSWLTRWFDEKLTFLALAYVGATLPIALQNHYYQPWSFIEAGLFCLGLSAIVARQYVALAAIVVIASLNRETALFLPLALLAFNWRSGRPDEARRGMLVGVALLAVTLALFFGLRMMLGDAPREKTLAQILQHNLQPSSLAMTLVYTGLFLGPFWLFALRGRPAAPAPVRRLSIVVPLYAAAILVWGVWYEVRLWMPLYPILLALALSYLKPFVSPTAAVLLPESDGSRGLADVATVT